MTNKETKQHLLAWCESNHDLFSWPTDGCGYDQHLRFVKHKNTHWYGGDFIEFVRDYANSLVPDALEENYDRFNRRRRLVRRSY